VLPEAGPVIGTVGRLHRQKGHTVLIDAAALVARDFPAARFVIIGEGEERAALERKAGIVGVAQRFEMTGASHDVPFRLASMDLFVLPSLWEGLPLTLLEAMAVGVPVVATSVDGVAEVIEDGEDGLLVPPGDSSALAAAIVRLLRDPQHAHEMGSRAMEKVKIDFGVDRMVRQTEEVYRRALAAG
jgi:glycosyltransferase involved in cell wall biosynthesis